MMARISRVELVIIQVSSTLKVHLQRWDGKTYCGKSIHSKGELVTTAQAALNSVNCLICKRHAQGFVAGIDPFKRR